MLVSRSRLRSDARRRREAGLPHGYAWGIASSGLDASLAELVFFSLVKDGTLVDVPCKITLHTNTPTARFLPALPKLGNNTSLFLSGNQPTPEQIRLIIHVFWQ
jgi:hypothetical protein